MPPEHPSPAQMGPTSTRCSFPSPQVLQQNTVQARFFLLMATIPHGSSKAHVPKVHGDSKCPFLLLSPKPLLQEGLDSFTTAGPSRREVMAELCPALRRAALPVPPTPGSDLLSQGVILVVSMEVVQHLSSKTRQTPSRSSAQSGAGNAISWRPLNLATLPMERQPASELTRLCTRSTVEVWGL